MTATTSALRRLAASLLLVVFGAAACNQAGHPVSTGRFRRHERASQTPTSRAEQGATTSSTATDPTPTTDVPTTRAPSPSSRPPVTTRPPQTSATGQGHATGVTAGKAAASTPKELEARLLVELPEEFDQDNDSDGTGPMDLADAAANESDQSTGEVRLRAEGFVRGHDRSWTDVVSNKDRYITLTLLQFGDQAGAEAEAAHTRDVIAGEGALDTHFDVPEIPGSFGAGGSDVKDGYAVVLFVRGPYMVLIDFEDQGSAATAMKGVVPLAESQFGRL